MANPIRREAIDTHKALRALQEERDLILSCLHHPKAANMAIARLTADQFYLKAHAMLFEGIKAAASTARPDPLTVRAEMLKASKLNEAAEEVLTETVIPLITVGRTTWLIDRIKETHKRRCLYERCLEAAEMALDPESESPAEKAMGLLVDVVASDRPDTLKPLATLLRENYDAIARQEKAKKDGTPTEITETGFYDIDKALVMTPGVMVVLAARPGMGKSALAFNIACNVAAYKPVIVFSREMSGQQLSQRVVASETGIEIYRQQQATLLKAEWEAMAAMLSGDAYERLWVDDASGGNVAGMLAKCRQVEGATGQRLGLVVVDYLGLIDGDRDNAGETERITQVSRGLKKMAMDLKVPVLALSQLNRQVEQRPNRRPTLSDLRQSGAIEQDADAVLFLYREDYYQELEKGKDAEKTGVAEVILAKNRSGKTGQVDLKFVPGKLQFYSVAHEYAETY